jgi:hypothetical protein
MVAFLPHGYGDLEIALSDRVFDSRVKRAAVRSVSRDAKKAFGSIDDLRSIMRVVWKAETRLVDQWIVAIDNINVIDLHRLRAIKSLLLVAADRAAEVSRHSFDRLAKPMSLELREQSIAIKADLGGKCPVGPRSAERSWEDVFRFERVG